MLLLFMLMYSVLVLVWVVFVVSSVILVVVVMMDVNDVFVCFISMVVFWGIKCIKLWVVESVGWKRV